MEKMVFTLEEFENTDRFAGYDGFIKAVISELDKMLITLKQSDYRICIRASGKRFTFKNKSLSNVLVTFTPSLPIDIEVRDKVGGTHTKIELHDTELPEKLCEIEQQVRTLLHKL